MERLKELLAECPFRGSEYEADTRAEEEEEESQRGWGVEGESAPGEVEEGRTRKRKKRAPRKVRGK